MNEYDIINGSIKNVYRIRKQDIKKKVMWAFMANFIVQFLLKTEKYQEDILNFWNEPNTTVNVVSRLFGSKSLNKTDQSYMLSSIFGSLCN